MPIHYVWQFPAFVCTKDDPWDNTKSQGLRVQHPDAVSDGEDRDYGLGEYTAVYRCPNCGKRFEVELPQ